MVKSSDPQSEVTGSNPVESIDSEGDDSIKKSILDTYSDDAFKVIVFESNSYSGVMARLGYYSYSSGSMAKVKQRIESLNLDISHFSIKREVRKLNFEDVFCENATVDSATLRRWYKKCSNSDYICIICKQEPFWEGQPLTLILDHVNGYNKDNRLENLRWVCPNCNMQLDTTNAKNKNHGERKYKSCILCGVQVTKKSLYCKQCYLTVIRQKEKKSMLSTFPKAQKEVNREELKELLRSISFLKIGKLYGVSATTLRRWCIKLNLPNKKSEIEKYSEEEWKKL